MKLEVNEDSKIVALWVRNDEDITKDIPINIKTELEKYKNLKFRICMYQSGNEDIKKNLLNLIVNNAS